MATRQARTIATQIAFLVYFFTAFAVVAVGGPPGRW
jgi:hypothetical protein